MPARLKLVVAYDGAPFAGWQSQASGNAVQDHLERAFEVVAKTRLRVHGAGRTDAGVHALGQVAHVELPERTLRPKQWTAALNASLLPTIRVVRCSYVRPDFHARFSARGKTYRYRIWSDAILPPLEVGRAWHVPGPLDLAAMQGEARAFLGTHDFGAFAANRGRPEASQERTIEALAIRRRGKCITIEISGSGFLYKMARMMVAALVQHARGRAPAGQIRARLAQPEKLFANARLVAPAAGLFLVRVRY